VTINLELLRVCHGFFGLVRAVDFPPRRCFRLYRQRSSGHRVGPTLRLLGQYLPAWRMQKPSEDHLLRAIGRLSNAFDAGW
jgi:hypothetical protein